MQEDRAPRFVSSTRNSLGESPIWSTREQALYWIDCNAPALFRLDPVSGEQREWPMPARIGGLALAAAGVVVILRTGIHHFDPARGDLSPIAPAPFDSDVLYLHEARCDPAGRLWVGLINHDYIDKGALGGAALFRLDGDRLVRQPVADGGTVSNGLAFSPAGDVLYYADTASRTIWRFDYDLATGTPSNRQVFHVYPESVGIPDGAAVDAEGGYWSAACRAGRLLRFLPDGRLERELPLPMRHPTQPAFGGPDLDRCYVTSLGFRADPADEADRDGYLLSCFPGVTGRAEPLFSG